MSDSTSTVDLNCAEARSLIDDFQQNGPNTVRQLLKKRPRGGTVRNLKWILFDVVLSNSTLSFQHFLALSDTPIFDIDAETHEDATDLHLACADICEENVGRWLQEGCERRRERLLEIYSALYYAVRTNNLRIARTFLNSRKDMNYGGWRQYTTLHLAARFGHLDVGRTLLANGANARIRDEDRRSPLHWACEYQHVDVAILLMESRWDTINLQDQTEMTPLMLATKTNNLECVCTLLEYGAKIDMCDHRGQTALHLAAQNGNAELLKFILQSTDASYMENYFIWSRDSGSELISLTCCALRSGNIECLEVLVSSTLSKNALQIPQLERPHPFDFHIYSPLAYLFKIHKSDDAKLNAFLQVFLKYKITKVHDYFNPYPAFSLWYMHYDKKFQNPLLFIFTSDLPSSRKEYYFDLLSANDITMDYGLQCYNDNRQPFSSLNNYINHYPLKEAFLAKDLEMLKFVMSNSNILEPDKVNAQFVSLVRKHREINFVELAPDICRYLMSLKPTYFIEVNCPDFVPNYPYVLLEERFSKSSLQQLCRTVIRHHLRDYTLEDNLRNFKRKIMELPLPTLLKDYLLFKN